MDIYPSILQDTATKTLDYIGKYAHVFTHFQIDIADGKFVENTTYSTKELAEVVKKNTPELSPQTTFEFHLMVEDIEKSVEPLEIITQYLPIDLVIVHFQPAVRWTKGDDQALHEKLHSMFPYVFGLSLNPEVDIDSHFDILKYFEVIQLMTVHPGAQGQAFLPEVLDKISQLRRNGYEGRIILDGAMNAHNLPLVLEMKDWPDAICPGSFFNTNVEKNLTELQTLVIAAEDKRVKNE